MTKAQLEMELPFQMGSPTIEPKQIELSAVFRPSVKYVIYSLRHRKCGVRGFIHELFVSKPERARYERVRAFDTNNE